MRKKNNPGCPCCASPAPPDDPSQCPCALVVAGQVPPSLTLTVTNPDDIWFSTTLELKMWYYNTPFVSCFGYSSTCFMVWWQSPTGQIKVVCSNCVYGSSEVTNNPGNGGYYECGYKPGGLIGDSFDPKNGKGEQVANFTITRCSPFSAVARYGNQTLTIGADTGSYGNDPTPMALFAEPARGPSGPERPADLTAELVIARYREDARWAQGIA